VNGSLTVFRQFDVPLHGSFGLAARAFSFEVVNAPTPEAPNFRATV
jgi:hypothetical protein